MKVILDVVINHPQYDTEIFTRSASSYIVEWRGHNVAYRIASFFNISGWMSRSESVDFNEYEDRMIIWEVLAPYGY